MGQNSFIFPLLQQFNLAACKIIACFREYIKTYIKKITANKGKCSQSFLKIITNRVNEDTIPKLNYVIQNQCKIA